MLYDKKIAIINALRKPKTSKLELKAKPGKTNGNERINREYAI
tara:strand:- start:50 stop:178 length:129 start_codon:yes stop_codon:yes gene_type:complete